MSSHRGIDHLVIAVGDLTSARDRYVNLGFTTTPLGRQPWGTGNHLVQFSRNFIELVGVMNPGELVPMSGEHFSFSAHNAEFLRRREGMSMLVLSTEDALADADEWRALGLRVHEPVHWSRQATLPDGSESTVAFTLSFVTDPRMPEIAFFSCQQHNPQTFWKPQYQQHANGAASVCAVTLMDEDPARHKAFFCALLGSDRLDEAADAMSIHCARGVVHVLSPPRFAARYPGAQLQAQTGVTALRAASLEVSDLDRVARCLDGNGVDYSRSDASLWLAERQCCGVVLEFVQTSA